MLVHLLNNMLAASSSPDAPPSPPSASFIRMYILCESGAGTLMSVAMMLNQILRIFNTHDFLLEQDMAFFTTEVMNVAARVKDLRPLGCTFVPPTLCMGWVTTPSEDVRRQLGEWMEFYRADFRGAKSTDFTGWLEHRFGRMRGRAAEMEREKERSEAGDSGIESLGEEGVEEEEFEITGTRPCCVM